MATPLTPALATEWMHVIRDLPPASIMQTGERRKPAVHAAWLARAIDTEAATAYATRWHEAGWQPSEWWQLAAATTIWEAREASAETPWLREVNGLDDPEPWDQWRELAAEIGALRATIAMRDDRDLPLKNRVFWATHETKVTRPGIGRPGEPIVGEADTR